MKKTIFGSIILTITAATLFVMPAMGNADPTPEGQTPKAQVQSADKGTKEAAPPAKGSHHKSMKHRGHGKNHARKDHGPDHHSADRELKQLTEKLDLNADQQAKVGKILKKNEEARKQERKKEIERMRAEREANMKKMKAQREAEAKEIESLLNADQKAKFSQMRSERKQKMGEMKKHHKGSKGHRIHGKRRGGHRPGKHGAASNAPVKADVNADKTDTQK